MLKPVKLLVISILVLIVTASVALFTSHAKEPAQPLQLQQQVTLPFQFVVLGDSRFTASSDPAVSNSAIRHALVKAIANAKPAFISFGGDIVYRGDHAEDWQVWDSETSAWREEQITVYPALGNHDLHGRETTALANYFDRFPALKEHRYYSVRIANCLMLALDSTLDEIGGPQGEWLKHTLDSVPKDVAFVILVLHHPPYTNSSDQMQGGGHSARSQEQALAKMLEQKQKSGRTRFVVFGGHVHNYERQEHGGVVYFVTGGGGARPYLIEHSPGDLYHGAAINYHYLLADVSATSMKVTMNRVDFDTGREVWTQPDQVTISVAGH
jgi:Icc-related predicted phosphoesterase